MIEFINKRILCYYMKKKGVVSSKKAIVSFQIIIMIISIFGMGFVIGDEESNKENTNNQAPPAVVGTAAVKPTSSYLSNLVGTGYAKNVYKYEGVYYKEGVKLSGGTIGEGDFGKQVANWQVSGSGVDALLSGVQWAGVAYMVGQMIGPMLGFDKKTLRLFLLLWLLDLAHINF